MSTGDEPSSPPDIENTAAAGPFTVDESLIRELSCQLTGDIIHKVNTEISIYRGLVAHGNQLSRRQTRRTNPPLLGELQSLRDKLCECESKLRAHLARARAAKYS
ncbi:hypothetical protein AW736_16455 [Termitidicoccus mucosus]|uniref:Uncharacterized protein n=1 Tax=Termitidicoccus mucosus TaxID=1184151 RepID=A0A178IF66_9BACT|nr:hypothetical protein AW736_16455 [Opitutaceae bacterium TSB47]